MNRDASNSGETNQATPIFSFVVQSPVEDEPVQLTRRYQNSNRIEVHHSLPHYQSLHNSSSKLPVVQHSIGGGSVGYQLNDVLWLVLFLQCIPVMLPCIDNSMQREIWHLLYSSSIRTEEDLCLGRLHEATASYCESSLPWFHFQIGWY